MALEQSRLIFGDNLKQMRALNKEGVKVDLICTDPPFNSGADYNMIFGDSDAQTKAFKDTWSYNGTASFLRNEIDTINDPDYIQLSKIMEGIDIIAPSSSMRGYLTYMAPRLLEMKKLLKPDGAIYLHCDQNANYYLKILMDLIFKNCHFREIIWQTMTRSLNTIWSPNHDTILCYHLQIPDSNTYKNARVPLSEEELKKKYPRYDSKGRYYSGSGNDLTPYPAKNYDPNKESQRTWKGVEPRYKNGVWSNWYAPRNSTYVKEFIEKYIPGYSKIESVLDRLDALDDAGFIHWDKNGRPHGKYYYCQEGKVPRSLCLDVKSLRGVSKEYLGYPTQKPVALYERFILASSNPGDIVLDPFAGSGTTLIAAQNQNRNWIGIELTMKAWSILKERLMDSNNLEQQKDYTIIGRPTNIQEVDLLIESDIKNRYHEFADWAVTERGLFPSPTRSNDGGIDGTGKYADDYIKGSKKSIEVVAQAKASKSLSMDSVGRFKSDMERKGADLGIFITRHEPTAGMRDVAAGMGYTYYRGAKIPKYQFWHVQQSYFDTGYTGLQLGEGSTQLGFEF